MPQVDGEQIFHALLRTHPTLPVILMSGLSAKQAAGAIGAQAAFIQKPFSAAGLLALLARTIAAAR